MRVSFCPLSEALLLARGVSCLQGFLFTLSSQQPRDLAAFREGDLLPVPCQGRPGWLSPEGERRGKRGGRNGRKWLRPDLQAAKVWWGGLEAPSAAPRTQPGMGSQGPRALAQRAGPQQPGSGPLQVDLTTCWPRGEALPLVPVGLKRCAVFRERLTCQVLCQHEGLPNQ